MTSISQLMTGPKLERTHAAARARVPMTEPEARQCVAERIAATGNDRSAVGMARIALEFGNLAPCAAGFYAAYIEAAE